MPKFPEPTHVDNPATIASAITSVPRDAHNHDPKDFVYPRRPYNAHGFLQSLIACGGGQNNYHPDGKRPFTLREFASLQTFPHGRPICEIDTESPLTVDRLQVHREMDRYNEANWKRSTAIAGKADLRGNCQESSKDRRGPELRLKG